MLKNSFFRLSVFLITGFSLCSCGLKETQVAEQDEVAELARDRGPEVQACYKQALKKYPQLPSGRMKIRADQHIDGSLHSIRLISGFGASNEVFNCVAQKVATWKTTPPKTWGSVDLTFEFENYLAQKRRPNPIAEEKEPNVH